MAISSMESCNYQPEGEQVEDETATSTDGEVESIDSLSEEEEDKDRVKDEILLSLESSVELQDMLKNPHLRKLLIDLDHTQNPAHKLNQLMQIPIFAEFAQQCVVHCTESRD